MLGRLSFLSILAISTSLASVARADETGTTIRYTVVAGDTCAAISTRQYGDPRLVDLIHSANPGMGTPPHALKPGTVLLLPPKPNATPSAPDAKLTWFRNQVEVRAPDPRPAKANDPLFRGNRVGTKESSNADVTFRDETQVRLSENTLVVILGDVNAKATKLSAEETTLVSGALRSRMSELAGAAPAAEKKITTASGSVALKSGSEAQVSVDSKNTTRVAVYKGSSSLTAQRKTVDVANGFGSKAEMGQAPTPPRPLPLAPLVESRAGDAFVTTTQPDVVFDLVPPPGGSSAPAAAQWHLQLARDAAFNDVLVDVQVPENVRTIETKNAAAGTYFARASAIDADAFEGKWSSLSSLGVIVLGLAPAEGGARATRIVSIAPSGATCAESLIDRRRAGAVACSMSMMTTASASPLESASEARLASGSLPLEAIPIRATHASVTMIARDRARVRLLDDAGQPVNEALSLSATTKDPRVAQGARVISRNAASGEYEVALFGIARSGGSTDLSFRLDDGVGGQRDVPGSNPLTIEPLKVVGPRTNIDVDVAGRLSAIQATQSGAVGFGADGLVALPSSSSPKRWWLGQLGLSADRILVAKGELTTGRDIARARGTILGAHTFVGARYRISSLLAPYLLLGPEIITTDTRVRQSGVRVDGSSVALGLGGGLGLELRTSSRSAVFVEIGGRWLADLTSDGSVINMSGGTMTIGHRFTVRE